MKRVLFRWPVVTLAATVVAGAMTQGAFASSSTSTTPPAPMLPVGGPPWGGLGPGPRATVQSVGSNALTVEEGGQTQTVDVSSSTVVEVGPGWTASLSDIQKGDTVTIRKVPGSSNVQAIVIDLPGIQGAVTSISGDSLGITQPSGRTATVNGTIPSGLAVGQSIQAVGTWSGDTLTAAAIRIVPTVVGGTITDVSGETLTVKTGSGTATVKVTSATTLSGGPQSITSADLVDGVGITASGSMVSGVLVASSINVMLPQIQGTVVSDSSGTLVLSTPSGQKTVTVTSSTKVNTPGSSTLSSGEHVSVVLAPGTSDALTISAGPGGPPSGGPGAPGSRPGR